MIATTPCGSNSSTAGFCFQRDVVVRDAFGAQPSRCLAREEVRGIEREKHFGEYGFGARLAGFASDDFCDVVAAPEDCVAKLAKHRTAFSERPR